MSLIASDSLPIRVTWNYEDAEKLRRGDEMICEMTREKKKLLPLILPGDDPGREGRSAASQEWSRGGRQWDELELTDGQWRRGGAAIDEEVVENNEFSSSSSSKSRRDRSRNSRRQTDASFSSSSPSIIDAPFSSSSSSPLDARPRPLPPWTCQTFRVPALWPEKERWWEFCAAEIYLSSIGFFGVTTGSGCVIRVWTFGDAGVGIRTGNSILLPDIFQLKGFRGKMTMQPEDGKGKHLRPFYSTLNPYF